MEAPVASGLAGHRERLRYRTLVMILVARRSNASSWPAYCNIVVKTRQPEIKIAPRRVLPLQFAPRRRYALQKIRRRIRARDPVSHEHFDKTSRHTLVK